MDNPFEHGALDQARAGATVFLLQQDGFCLARNLVPRTTLQAVEQELDEHFQATPFCEGDFYGERTKRFGRLLARSRSMAELVMNPIILDVAQHVLGAHCDTIQLNVTQAIEIHPGAPAQFPHRDQDMWPGADGAHEFLVNVIWPLTPFTEHNGATRIWPHSHAGGGGGRGVGAGVSDPSVCAVSEPGEAIVFLGSTLHGAGANLSQDTRRALVVGYSLGWLKPYENPWLAYPPAVARTFPRALAELAGYRQHRPNLGNFEGRCPSILLEDTVPARLGAVDALRPDQTAALAQFVADQRRRAGDRTMVERASRP